MAPLPKLHKHCDCLAGSSICGKCFLPVQVSGEKEFFAKMVVDGVSALDPDTLDLSLLGIKKVQGGGLRDSFLVDGVAFKKTFSYAGFEMQKKKYSHPKILALNIELELKSEKENAEVSHIPYLRMSVLASMMVAHVPHTNIRPASESMFKLHKCSEQSELH